MIQMIQLLTIHTFFQWRSGDLFFLVGVNLFREIGEIKVETRFWSGGEWSIAPDYRVGVAEAGQLCFAAMEIVTMLEISRWLEMPQFPMKNRWICCFNLLQEIYISYYIIKFSWKEMLPAFVANLQSHVLPNRRKHVMSPCSNCWKISWTTQPRFAGEMGGWCVELRGGGTIRKRIVYNFCELCMFRMFWYVLAILGFHERKRNEFCMILQQ